VSANRSHRICIAALILVALSGVSTLARSPDRKEHAGAAACAECHPDIHDAWSGAAHANTLRPPGPESLPPGVLAGPVRHAPGESRFVRDDGEHLVETVGDSGEVERFPLAYVVGLQRIRMFVARLPNGRLQVLPGMRDERRGEWFDYTHLIFGVPGADPLAPPRVSPGEDRDLASENVEVAALDADFVGESTQDRVEAQQVFHGCRIDDIADRRDPDVVPVVQDTEEISAYPAESHESNANRGHGSSLKLPPVGMVREF